MRDPAINKNNKTEDKNLASQQTLAWSSFMADAFEDTFAGILGFIPNGIGIIYDDLLKNIPLLGTLFEVQTIETLIKLLLGVTIGQGIALDLAKYIFRPIGFICGVILGNTLLTQFKSPAAYKGKVGEIFYHLSGQTVLGALLGIFAVTLGFGISSGLGVIAINGEILLLSLAVGASVGLIAKAMLLLAVNMVNQANAANLRRSVKRAKDLGTKLKEVAKQKAKSRVYREAQDLIQQMNGAQSQENLEAFFKCQYETIVYQMNLKINRHFDYLVDRACSGDMEALKKLQALVPKRQMNKYSDKSALEVMIDRIFNQRTLFQLKDDIDNSYDKWRYSLHT